MDPLVCLFFLALFVATLVEGFPLKRCWRISQACKALNREGKRESLRHEHKHTSLCFSSSSPSLTDDALQSLPVDVSQQQQQQQQHGDNNEEEYIVTRHTVVPTQLYRVQTRLPVKLRSYDEQMALGRTSFDLKLVNGLVSPAEGEIFTGPNGMSVRPLSAQLRELVEKQKESVSIFSLPVGCVLPERLVLLHEHSDHYALQARVSMSLDDLHELLTEFLKTLPLLTKKEFLEQTNEAKQEMAGVSE